MSPVPANDESVYLRRVAAAGLMSPAPLADDAHSAYPQLYQRASLAPAAPASDRRGEREQKINDVMERMQEFESRLRHGPAFDERYIR